MGLLLKLTRTQASYITNVRPCIPRCSLRVHPRRPFDHAMTSTSTEHPVTRGAFIVFEGVDRCGKTTQSKLLEQHLRRHNVKVERWCFPDRSTFIGQCINTYLQDKSLTLDPVAVHHMFVANRHEKRAALAAALRCGTTVIVDRYSYSGCAYSTAKGLAGLSHQFCRDAERGLPAADAVLYMRLSPEALRMRGGFGEERYENVDMQTKVIQNFEALHDDTWKDFDASQSIEAIHQLVVMHAQQVMEECHRRPISRLWDGQPYVELADHLPAAGPASTPAAAPDSAPSTAAPLAAEAADVPAAAEAQATAGGTAADATAFVSLATATSERSGKTPRQAVPEATTDVSV